MSKLHRMGVENIEAVTWAPLSKSGSHLARSVHETAGVGYPLSAPELEARVSDLQRDLSEQTQSAYHRGFGEGQAAARQEGAIQLQAALERMARTVEEIAAARPRLRHEAEQDIVKLAMAVARRILYRELATDPEALVGLVRSALDKLDGREVHRLRANPQDAAMLHQYFQQANIPRRIDVIADAGLPRGAAIFETEHGLFDASVETQLKEIERGFTDLVKRSA